MERDRDGASGGPDPPTINSDNSHNRDDNGQRANPFQLAIEEAQRRGAGPLPRPTPPREGTPDQSDRAAA